jgi:hypothetical protein
MTVESRQLNFVSVHYVSVYSETHSYYNIVIKIVKCCRCQVW